MGPVMCPKRHAGSGRVGFTRQYLDALARVIVELGDILEVEFEVDIVTFEHDG